MEVDTAGGAETGAGNMEPPWSPVEGKYSVKFQEMLPDSDSIQRVVHFWEVPFALILSSGWDPLLRTGVEASSGGLQREERYFVKSL